MEEGAIGRKGISNERTFQAMSAPAELEAKACSFEDAVMLSFLPGQYLTWGYILVDQSYWSCGAGSAMEHLKTSSSCVKHTWNSSSTDPLQWGPTADTILELQGACEALT